MVIASARAYLNRRIQQATLLVWGTFAAAAAWAQPSAITDRDIIDFLAAYRVPEATRVLLDEVTAQQVESGQLSVEMAACMQQRFPMTQVEAIVAPVVRQAYADPQQLRATTEHLRSPRGAKLMDGTLVLLRESLWRQQRGQQDIPAGWPASFTREDVRSIANFGLTPAGQTFKRFSDEWLPQMQRHNLWRQTQEGCQASGVPLAPASPPAPPTPAQLLPGQWRHVLQVRAPDGRQQPAQVIDSQLVLAYRPDGQWETVTPRQWQKGRYRFLENGLLEETTLEHSRSGKTNAVGTRQVRVDGHRLELITVFTREQLDKQALLHGQPGEVRPNGLAIINIFRRVPSE
jgi:hypothetical protein